MSFISTCLFSRFSIVFLISYFHFILFLADFRSMYDFSSFFMQFDDYNILTVNKSLKTFKYLLSDKICKLIPSENEWALYTIGYSYKTKQGIEPKNIRIKFVVIFSLKKIVGYKWSFTKTLQTLARNGIGLIWQLTVSLFWITLSRRKREDKALRSAAPTDRSASGRAAPGSWHSFRSTSPPP